MSSSKVPKLLQSRVGVFSDIHLGNYRDDSKWHTIAIDLSKWIADQYRQNDIKDVIIPGDIFHNRFDVSVATLDCAKKFFDSFKDFNVIITTGNHDSYYRDRSDINSLEIFDEWPNITVISREVQTIDQFDRRIALCPWATKIDSIPQSDIIFGHFEIAGFMMSPGKICATGIASKDITSKGQLIISGHFHQAAERKYNGGVIKYIGTPYQLNWAESNDNKFIYILDVETLAFERIQNTVSPRHIKIRMTDWMSKCDMSQVPGNIINAIVDQQTFESVDIENGGQQLNATVETTDGTVHAFLSDIVRLGPIDYRTTYLNILSNIISCDKEFDGVDILHSMREFVELLDIDAQKKKAVLEKLADLYAQNEIF